MAAHARAGHPKQVLLVSWAPVLACFGQVIEGRRESDLKGLFALPEHEVLLLISAINSICSTYLAVQLSLCLYVLSDKMWCLVQRSTSF